MEESARVLRNRTVGRNTSSSYRDMLGIRSTPYPLTSNSSPARSYSTSPRRRAHHSRLSLSPSKLSPTRNSPSRFSDRFIPRSSSAISLRHLLSSPPPRLHRDGSQSPTNPQLKSPGKDPEWPNSLDDALHSHRLASALEIPISPKLLQFSSPSSSPIRAQSPTISPSLLDPPSFVRRQHRTRSIPPDPFRILDAPELRDDYYAQPLSWSITGTVAVALGMDVYIWHPDQGVSLLPIETVEDVTSVAFNSTGDILAIAREDGSILLHSPYETSPRVYIAPIVPEAVGALSWRPNWLNSTSELQEYLVIGTYDGQVVLVEVTWELEDPKRAVVEKKGLWNNVHTDQICGIAWSNDGLCFATGANDNKLVTYEMEMGIGVQAPFSKTHEWVHEAAIKALAFRSGKGGVLAAGS
jgi:WD40 repeat protein